MKLREASLAGMRALLSDAVRARLRLIAVSAGAVLGLNALSGGRMLDGHFESLARALAREGLVVAADEQRAVVAQGLGNERTRFVFRAGEDGMPADVWVAYAVVAADGGVADFGALHNLTRTSSADESTPVLLGHWAMVSRRIEGEFVGFELFDLASEPPTDQGVRQRFQRGVSNLQATGTWAGIGRRSYHLRTPARSLSLRSDGHAFIADVDGVRVVIAPAIAQPLEGASLVEARSRATVVADLVPWLVDTARELSWIGPERIAWLENKVFSLRDSAKQAYHSVSTVDHASEAAQELGVASDAAPEEEAKVERLSVPDPDSGWPPAALVPLTTPEVAGEGKWRAIVDDPYVRELPDGSPVFYQTFLRADPQRTWARVYLTVWDPRLVQLNVVAGTAEPVSATGETGSGAIPRDRELLPRVVAAFNGGFQAVHGEFGMMADGRVYLPPKPWAATVAVFHDGRVGMGTWLGPADGKAEYDEARAVADIPKDMVSFRQNLTSLVEDGRFNPWSRWWWGAAPQQKSEQTLTQRSALCLTREGFMLYAWGDSASPEALGAALMAARCVRAMHLDMNAGHSGMEFYNVLAPHEKALPKEPPATSRFEGSLPEAPGFVVRARKAVTSMGMPLPRYIHPDPRDYFYLALKPGVRTLAAPAGMDFVSADLPHAGWPPAFARHLDDDVRLLRIDPSRALPKVEPAAGGEVLLAELRGHFTPAMDDVALYSEEQRVGTRFVIGVAPPDAPVWLRGPALARTPEARAAIGVEASGLLVYAETTKRDPALLIAALARAGVTAALALPTGARLGLMFKEGLLGIDGATRVREGEGGLRFVASSVPAAEVLFPENKPMPYARWAKLQDQRVRYFRTAAPTSNAPAGALAPASE